MKKVAATQDQASAWQRMMAAAGVLPSKDTLTTRAKLEQRSTPSREDGRRARATGRTAQLNVKCRPETKAAMKALAARRKLGLGELLDLLIEKEARNA